jgi:hypothetical protein
MPENKDEVSTIENRAREFLVDLNITEVFMPSAIED